MTEEELHHERSFVSAILDTVGALIVVLDRAGRIVRFNRACERTTGYTFAEVRDRCIWDMLLIPEEMEPAKDVFERLLAGNYPLESENSLVTKDGRRRLIAWSNTVLIAGDGTVEHVIATGIDITERRQAEQEIRHMSSFPQSNPNPVLEVDASGAIIFYNSGTLTTLIRLKVEPDVRLFLPSDIQDIIHDLFQRQVVVTQREVAIGDAIFAESIYLAPGFGTIRIFASDITERKRMEKELRQSNTKLRARNVDLDAFAHTVAHDIKSPLHVIIGYADALAENFAVLPVDGVAESVEVILRNARKIDSITDSLLLLSEVRRKEVTVLQLDMAAIVAEARQRVAHLIDDQTEIRLPDASAWPKARGYAMWIEQVWVNFLTNALRHAGRPLRLELGGAPQGDGLVRFWIRDDGIGIPPEDQPRLFTEFSQTRRAHDSGHGLGLSIVKRIVEQLGGVVAVQSSGVPGEGSVFSFTLPAA